MSSDRGDLWDLYRGLAQRGYGGGDDSGPLLATLGTVLAGLRRPYRRSFDGRPPRRIATAMAAALFAQPHVAWTWRQHADRSGTVDPGGDGPPPPDSAIRPSVEQLEVALGLPQWELDDLREEVDRRAGQYFRQQRFVDMLWDRFNVSRDPTRLFDALFPGVGEQAGTVDFVRRGPQLYVLTDRGGASSPLALYLSWAAPPPADQGTPVRFWARYADPSLVRALSRSSGESLDELRRLLDNTIAVLPRDSAAEWLAADGWRARGMGPLTWLGWPYGPLRALNAAVDLDETEWQHWLRRTPQGEVVVEGRPRAVFDTLAIERVQDAMRQIYAGLLAHLDRGPERPATDVDLALLDVERHMRQVLTPLIQWVSAPRSCERIAREMDMPIEVLAPALTEVHQAWTTQLNRSWIAPPHTHHSSLLALLLPHLVTLSGSLRALLQARPDVRAPHRDVLQLFTAFYLREAPLERLWIRGLADTVAHDGQHLMEDVPGDWFWGTWQRVLDVVGDDTSAT